MKENAKRTEEKEMSEQEPVQISNLHPMELNVPPSTRSPQAIMPYRERSGPGSGGVCREACVCVAHRQCKWRKGAWWWGGEGMLCGEACSMACRDREACGRSEVCAGRKGEGVQCVCPAPCPSTVCLPVHCLPPPKPPTVNFHVSELCT